MRSRTDNGRRITGSPITRHLSVAAAAAALFVGGVTGVQFPAHGAAAVEPTVSTTAPPTPTTVPPTQVTVDVLRRGERLVAGQSLTAGRFRLVMQTDGNLVEYGDLAVYDQSERVYWQTRTAGNPGAFVVMQTDGNLVVYSAGGRPLWQSGTAGYTVVQAGLSSVGFFSLYGNFPATPTFPGGVRLISRGGGQIYDWKLTSGGTMRSPDELQALLRPFDLVMQGDGNLVMSTEVRHVDTQELIGYKRYWQSGTSGHPGAFAVMQTDGNLVVYSRTRRPLWNSRTDGNPGAHLDMQDDGNLVIYSRSGRVLWHTGTDGVAGPVIVK